MPARADLQRDVHEEVVGVSKVNQAKFDNAVLYLLRGLRSKPGQTQLVKLLYFADRQHYRQFLSPITGGRYVALQKGPVIDDYKQLFADLVERNVVDIEQVDLGSPLPKSEYSPRQDVDLAVLSDSERMVLDQVIAVYGDETGTALSQITHRDGPWLFAWDPNREGVPIPYILFRWLDNMPDDEDLVLAKEGLKSPVLKRRISELNSVAMA